MRRRILSARAGGQRGFSMIELVLTAAAMMISLLAGLSVFDAFGRSSSENSRLTAQQDAARTAIDQVVRDLRNAAPTSSSATAVQRAGAYDLVFLTDRPGYGTASGSSRLVRYCVEATSATTGRLRIQIASTGQTTLSATACPDTTWGTTGTIVEDVVNLALTTPLWTYDSATPASVRSIRVHLLLDDSAFSRPPPVEIQSGVYLRNRSLAAPTASSGDFGAACSGSAQALLSTTLSVDANGDPLTTTFGDNGVTVGSGGSIAHKLTSGAHDLTLTVTNVLGLSTILHRTLSCP